MNTLKVHFNEENILSTSSISDDTSKIKESMLQLLNKIELNINEISDFATTTYQHTDVLKKKISQIVNNKQVDAAIELANTIHSLEILHQVLKQYCCF